MAPLKYTNPRWFEAGMTVFAPWERFCRPEERERARERGTGVRCRVTVAAGTSARIRNEKYGIDRWMSMYDLTVPIDDVHAR